MRTLQRVLASGVVDALRAREHVVVAPAGADALCDEVEAIIAPALEEMAPHFTASSPARSLSNDEAEEVMAAVVMQITEQLMESDHVDDIYAEDRVIRRDAYRAIREILVAYIRGDVEVEEEPERASTFQVHLDSLGYVAATVSRRLDDATLMESLVRAAGSVGATLVELDGERNLAGFDLAGGAEVGRLALEEAITEELFELVEACMVELPSVEQMLEVEHGISELPGFDQALGRAAARTQGHTGCAAGCVALDETKLIAVLTPLSDEAAANVEAHFNFFLGALEQELAALEEPPPATPPASGRKKTAKARAKSNGARPSQTRARGASGQRKRRA